MSLHSVEEEAKEFICVLLNPQIGWLSIILKGKAEVKWVRVLPLGKLQESEELLELPQHIVVNFPFLVLFNLWRGLINCLEERVSELRHHIELLDHRYHVADAAVVLYSSKGIETGGSLLIGWLMPPLFGPTQVFDHWPEVVLKEVTHFFRFESSG